MGSTVSDHEESSKMKDESDAWRLKGPFCFTRLILKKGTKNIEI